MPEHDVARGRTARAVGWSSVAYACRVGTQLATLLVLSRLLTPSDFGVMAMAAVVTGLALVVRDLGAGPAVIRAPVLTESYVSSQFVVAVGFGLLLAVAVAALAPAVAALFGTPAMVPLLDILAVGFAVGGFAVVPQALLERRYDFRPIALAELLAGIAGLGAAIAAALADAGSITFGIQVLVQTIVSALLLAIAARWLPTRWPTTSEVAAGLRFGTPLAGFSALNYLVRNADNALIGISLGSGPLGYYSVAYRLMLLPVQIVNSIGNRVLLPLLSRSSDEPAAQRTTYLTAVATAALVGCPLAAGLAGAADQVVAVLLGPNWAESVAVLRVLALVAVTQVIGATVGPVLVATGRTRRLFIWGVVSSALTVTAFVIGLPYGIVGVATAYALVSAALFVPSLVVGLAPIGVHTRAVLSRVTPALIAAAAAGAAVFLVGVWLSWIPALIVLAVQAAVLLVVYGAAVRVLDRPALTAARQIAAELGA